MHVRKGERCNRVMRYKKQSVRIESQKTVVFCLVGLDYSTPCIPTHYYVVASANLTLNLNRSHDCCLLYNGFISRSKTCEFSYNASTMSFH